MRLNVKDGEGEDQVIVVNGEAVVSDRSTTIVASGVAQDLMAANAERGGWLLQNLGTVPLLVSEIDDAAVGTAFQVQPLGLWPPAGYPVTVSAISVISSEQGAIIVAREW